LTTIKDIAKAADVSIATVSMVLNNSPRISKKTRDKVLETAKRLDYIPSFAAKTLKTNKSKTISVIVGDIVNPFFPELIKGVEASARSHGYSVMIYDMSVGEDAFYMELNKSISQQVDGLFITGVAPVSDKTMEKLNSLCDGGMRIVSCNKHMKSDKFPIIISDDKEQIESLIYRLVANGHKNIGCISGKKDYWVTTQREGYFREIISEFGLYRENFVINAGFTFEDGNRGVRELLSKHPEITAVMCIADTLGIGCSKEAQKMGLSIPGDLSLFSVDGIEYMKFTSPQITTVNTHRYEYGFAGTERLIEMIESNEPLETFNEDLHYPCSIMEGETISKPRS